MMFGKSEKKHRHIGLTLSMWALAAVGAMSILNSSKKWICDKSKKIMGFLRASDMTDSTGG